MKRNPEEVKYQFLEVCRNYDIQEVYINFDNPFTEIHEKWGEEIYVVPKNPVGTSGALYLEFVFAPNYASDDKEAVMSIGICTTIIKETGEKKEEILQNLKNSGFKLIYSLKEGILFE